MALKDSAMMLFVERDGGRMMISDLIQRWSVEVVKFNSNLELNPLRKYGVS
jgi:hypothetical protein